MFCLILLDKEDKKESIMHIFLIRHGESTANVGENYIKHIPDHLVSLTEQGKAQARENGEWRWFHYSPEWYHEERNPKNCWIREIKDGEDLGYINQKTVCLT